MQNGMKLQVSVKESELDIDGFLEPIESILQEGRNDLAYRLLKALQGLQGRRQWVDDRLSSLYRKWIPRWHFEMLNDANRGTAFMDALAALDLRDKTVIDIGAGSGILSMLCVRRGARHVYACEMVKALADKAEEIVRHNGMAHKITIIPKSSFDIQIGQDMPERAEVMVSETIDCGFVGEGFLPSLRHAKRELLKPHALLVPSAVQLCGALVESPHIHHLNHVDRSQGFDVSKMNEFSTPGYFGVRLKTRPHQMMSEMTSLVELDLYSHVPERLSRVVEFEALQTGTVHGVVFWFKVTLAPGITLSNDPDQADCHWTQAFASFSEPLAVQKCGRYPLELTFSDQSVNIAPMEQPRHHRIAAVNGNGARERILNVV
jgi:protein arginine N-methyltransferase 1